MRCQVKTVNDLIARRCVVKRLYIGLDIGSATHEAVMLNENHGVVKKLVVKQTILEISRFIEIIQKCKDEGNFEEVLIGLEGSNGYASPMDRMLVEVGFSLIAINSATLDKYRKLVGQPRKDDPYDAELVCKYLIDVYQLKGMKQNAQRIGNPDQASKGKLRIVTRHHRTTKRDLTRITNRLRKHILGYFPDFLTVFPNLHTKTARVLLKYYGTVGKVKKSRESTVAKAFINKRRRVGPKSAAKLKALVKDIRYVDPLEDEMGKTTQSLVEQIDLLLSQIEILQEQIAEMANEMPEVQLIAKMIPGAGINNSSELIAEFGNISRFLNRDKLSIYCGVGCLNHSSGKKVSARKPTHFNHYAKGALCMMAQAAIVNDSESRKYYDKKRKEGKGHWHAIKCLAKYLLRHIFQLLSEMQVNATQEKMAA